MADGPQIITSRDNSAVRETARLLESRKYRKETGLFVTEGLRLSVDAMESGVPIRHMLYTKEAAEKYPQAQALMGYAEKSSLLAGDAARRLGDTDHPQGIFCICHVLDNTADAVTIVHGGKYLLLCSLQDPGNLGTVVRTAEAFGLDGVFLSKDCPDLYSPKALRGTMGGIFRVPWMVLPDVFQGVEELRRGGIAVYAAALTQDAVPIQKADFSAGACIVIGNEGSGLPDDIVKACGRAVKIPMAGRAQSLNAAVAAAVAAWEMARPE